MSVLAEIKSDTEGNPPVVIYLEQTPFGEHVYYISDADIDADGANGQNGKPAAYQIDNNGKEIGTDRLANLDIHIVNKIPVFKRKNSPRNVITDEQNEPRIFPGGIIASKTSLKRKGVSSDDPAAYIDSETVCYIAIPSVIIKKTQGKVMGCRTRVAWKGQSVECIVADSSGERIGELSIAAARALGMSGNPGHGGSDNDEVHYELWPGQMVTIF
ncbi:hypothetical protein ACXGQP_02480 [Enterobacter oligotrophicus]